MTSTASDAESLLPAAPAASAASNAVAGNAAATGDAQKASNRVREDFRAQEFAKSLVDVKADAPWKEYLALFFKYVAKPLIVVIMAYVWVVKKLYYVYTLLPMNVVQMIFGVALCFFGGVYFTVLAAAEAFRSFGGQALLDEVSFCWEQAMLIQEASDKDDAVDANKDGIVDVNQMSTNELISHKAKVAMVALTEPEKLTNALQYLLTAYLSVLATLRMQFAKTVALALGIADMIQLPFVRVLGPLLALIMGKDLNHWVAPIISTSVKIIAVVVATYVQSMISAFYSAIRGGRLFGEAAMNLAGPYLPDSLITKPFDPNNSYWDEAIGFPLAAVGFWYQFTHGFALEFPYSVALFPCTAVEYFLRWQVFSPV